jgi:hypothetical protein
MLSYLAAGIVSLLAVAVTFWGSYEWQRRQGAVRIVNAINAEDEGGLLRLLTEGTDFKPVAEWFGESALIISMRSLRSGSDAAVFAEKAVTLLASHGADVNEPGAEWKTALMHAAASGHLGLCAVLLSYGADAKAHDMFGRTAACWAQLCGHQRIASLLRKAAP